MSVLVCGICIVWCGVQCIILLHWKHYVTPLYRIKMLHCYMHCMITLHFIVTCIMLLHYVITLHFIVTSLLLCIVSSLHCCFFAFLLHCIVAVSLYPFHCCIIALLLLCCCCFSKFAHCFSMIASFIVALFHCSFLCSCCIDT